MGRARIERNLDDQLSDDFLDKVAAQVNTHLKTTNHINDRPNPTNFTLFNLSEILMKVPAYNNVADVLAKYEGQSTMGLGLVWNEIKGMPGVTEIVPEGMQVTLNEFAATGGSASSGGGVNFAGGGKDAPKGSVDPTPGGNGGDWGGTMPLLLAWTNVVKGPPGKGLQVTNNKRATRNTKSGGMSDHYQGNLTAYAEDLFSSGTSMPDKIKDEAAIVLCKAIGFDYNGKDEIEGWNKTEKGYRYQILYRTQVGGNHNNHIHVGVKKV